MKLSSRPTGLLLLCLTSFAAQGLDRPQWMDEPGIVMAGSWEAPCYRGRGAGRMDFTLPPEKVAAYQREHSREMIRDLKDLGVNFLMIHGYKGAGMATEWAGMQDARRFAELARKNGMRVGAYIGGTMLYEKLFVEEPLAREWQAFAADGTPVYYTVNQHFRYASVRNHPGFIDYLQEPTRFAIRMMGSDMIHYDNFGLGAASCDDYSRQRFRAFLQAKGKAPADPPVKATKDEPLVREWREYKCEALTEFYARMCRFIREQNPQCAVECNPGSVDDFWGAMAGNDFARLLPLGNAFWDESYGSDSPHVKGPAIKHSRIRSMKVGRLYDNSVFCYTDTPLDAAECMAFNLNCLGCVAWFQWGELTSIHENRPVLPSLRPYIRFFNKHQELYRNVRTVADVAVLRTWADQNFGPRRFHPVEQALIEGHAAWRIIYDEQVNALEEYRAVVVPDKAWLTPRQEEKLAAFAARGGRVVRSSELKDSAAVLGPSRGESRMLVDAPTSVAVELCQQERPERVLVHLVNYEPQRAVKDLSIRLKLKGPGPKSARVLSPDGKMSRTVRVSLRDGFWSCTVPELQVYAVVVLNGAKLE